MSFNVRFTSHSLLNAAAPLIQEKVFETIDEALDVIARRGNHFEAQGYKIMWARDIHSFTGISPNKSIRVAATVRIVALPGECASCPKCDGLGIITAYIKVGGGRCYSCKGTGVLNTQPFPLRAVAESLRSTTLTRAYQPVRSATPTPVTFNADAAPRGAMAQMPLDEDDYNWDGSDDLLDSVPSVPEDIKTPVVTEFPLVAPRTNSERARIAREWGLVDKKVTNLSAEKFELLLAAHGA